MDSLDHGINDETEKMDEFFGLVLSPIKSFGVVLEEFTGPTAGNIEPERLMLALSDVYSRLVEDAERRIDEVFNEVNNHIGPIELTFKGTESSLMKGKLVKAKTSSE
ncbi:MAG: hypothetical protein ACLFNW_10655 [Desulfobacterales bacterium]